MPTKASATGTNHRRQALLPFLFTLGALTVSFAASSTRGWGIPCLFHALTGIPCPSCGMTRAFLALSHGRFHEALDLHLASPCVYLAAWVILVLSTLQLLRGRDLLTPTWHRLKDALVPLTLILMALAWLLNLYHWWFP
jgi:hypothetical protein